MQVLYFPLMHIVGMFGAKLLCVAMDHGSRFSLGITSLSAAIKVEGGKEGTSLPTVKVLLSCLSSNLVVTTVEREECLCYNRCNVIIMVGGRGRPSLF